MHLDAPPEMPAGACWHACVERGLIGAAALQSYKRAGVLWVDFSLGGWMEKEAVREFFEDTRKAGLRTRELRERMEEVRVAAHGVRGARIRERVQESGCYDVGDELIRIERATMDYLEASTLSLAMEYRALRLLRMETNDQRAAIMIARFLNQESWKQVGEEFGRSSTLLFKAVRDTCARIAESEEAERIMEEQLAD